MSTKGPYREVTDLFADVELEAGRALEVEDVPLDAEVVLRTLLLPDHQQHLKPVVYTELL